MELMRAQEVIISNPQSQIIVGAIVIVESVCGSIRSFISTVEAFDHLFVRPKFFGNSIIVCKAYDLGDIELELFAEFMEELLGGKRVGAVAIGNEAEVFREFLQMLEGHAHRHNAGTNAPIVRYLIANHSAGCRIDDQPDIAFDTADFYVSLISSKGRSLLVRVCINEWFDADGGGLTVVGDHLVRDGDSVDVFHGLSCFAQGQAEVDPVGKTQGHDISVVLAEFQRGSVLWQGGDVHLKEIDCELTVDVMQLIFVLAIILVQICSVNLLEVAEIVRALGVHTLMNDEMLPVFLTRQSM